MSIRNRMLHAWHGAYRMQLHAANMPGAHAQVFDRLRHQLHHGMRYTTITVTPHSNPRFISDQARETKRTNGSLVPLALEVISINF